MYSPTAEDIAKVVELLHKNGVDVSNSKAAYEELKSYQGNQSFCILLAAVFAAEVCPIPHLSLPVAWSQYRQLAAITLKNNIAVAKHSLGEEVVKEAARCALIALHNPPDPRIARASAQIVSKVTSLTSISWWSIAGIGDIASILLNDLLPAGGLKTLGSLYTLQYLMEDLPKQVGQSSENIIIRVSQLAGTTSASLDIRKAAFKMCFSIYEQSSLLEWNVETLSPLQQGLVNASYTFAQTCTFLLERSCDRDSALYVCVLRSCLLLLDYFDYFPELSVAEQQKMTQWWIATTIHAIPQTDSKTNQELLSAAINLISSTVEAYDRSGGEGAMSFLLAPVSSAISELVTALVRYSFLSDEEVSSILEADDASIRDDTGFRLESVKKEDISQDDVLDEDEAAMTLRRSALRCIDTLCSYSSTLTFQALMAQTSALWGHTDFHSREAGIVLVGTMASGCAVELEGVLSSVVDQLVYFVTTQDEHVCVSSIAIWSLSRLCEQIVASIPLSIDIVISAIAGKLTSTSRRIQHSSISALNSIIGTLNSLSQEEKVNAHMINLLTVMRSCVSLYSGTNLSLLMDLVCQLTNVMSEYQMTPQIDQLCILLKNERFRRFALFQESYKNLYVNNVATTLLDKDVFSVDRGILGLLSKQLDNDYALNNLCTWSALLMDILSRGADEDADLIFSVVCLCCGYLNLITTANLQQCNECFNLSSSGMQLLQKAENKSIKLSVVMLLTTLVRNVGHQVIPDSAYEPLLEYVATYVADEDDVQVLNWYVNLATVLLRTFPSSPTERVIAAAKSLAAALRSDVFGDTEFYYTKITFNICQIIRTHPSIAGDLPLSNLFSLLVRACNDQEKAEATVNLCDGLCGMPPYAIAENMQGVIQLTLSWQQVAHTFPGVLDALRQLLCYASSQNTERFQAILGTYPLQTQQMVSAIYFSQ